MFKKIKKFRFTLLALLLFIFMGLSASNSYAFYKACWHGGHCRWHLGSCKNQNYSTPWSCSDLLIAMPDPASDYILKKPNGQAFIVLGNDVTPIASDMLENFCKEIDNKYPEGKREDEKAQQNLQEEFDNFLKKSDDGKVSDANLQKWSKESGLSILDKAPSSTTTGTITLRIPRLDSSIDLDSKQPVTFAWTSNVKGPHTIKLFVVKEGQTPEDAMKNSKPVYQKEGITTGSDDILPDKLGVQPGVKIMCVVSSGDVIGYNTVNSTRSNIKRGK